MHYLYVIGVCVNGVVIEYIFAVSALSKMSFVAAPRERLNSSMGMRVVMGLLKSTIPNCFLVDNLVKRITN
jgi:hypothetical protein